MSVIGSNILAGASGSQGYQISRSVRLRSSASAFFNRTPASAGNRKLWTWSGWLKRGVLGGNSGIFSAVSGLETLDIAFEGNTGAAGDTLRFVYYTGAALNGNLVSTPVYRDPSGWYHIVAVWDTDNATASNRMRLYVNGVEITAFGTSSYPSSGTSGLVNNTVAHAIGRYSNLSRYFDGYITEVNFIDGQALTPSSFGQTNATTGVWSPIKYTGTYGTNGFYLNFSDNSAATAAAIGKDYSGNGNNWTPNNISVTSGVTYDSMLDVPTQWADGGNGRGNYCVLNPLSAGSIPVISNGNLQVVTGNGTSTTLGSIQIPSTGKWYFEYVGTSNGNYCYCGISETSYTNNSLAYYAGDGNKYINGVASSYGATYTNNDVIGVAVNSDSGTVTFYKNNTSQGDISYTISDKQLFAYFADGSGGVSSTIVANFGQRPFSYTPPTGFKALNTLNLPTPTILKGNQYMDATLYTGTGASQSITNTGSMQPDLVWVKGRSGATDHALYDSVRGVQKQLESNTTTAETTETTGLTAFNSNGFTVGALAQMNTNTATYVGWQWRAGVSAVTNTAGSITSTVDAGATQGFSVVTYTGTGAAATVGHGLGVAPSMIIVRNRTDGTVNWRVYHTSIGATNYLSLNLTNASAAASSVWNNTAPTSSVFSVANDGGSNGSTNGMVAYCFAEVAGFSKFGSYTGNGSADGPFVFCGFRPRFVLIKRTDSANDWIIYDSARDTNNVERSRLYPNASAAEDYLDTMDFVSNGFKLRTAAGTAYNTNGGTYIFAAFAENPTKYALAR